MRVLATVFLLCVTKYACSSFLGLQMLSFFALIPKRRASSGDLLFFTTCVAHLAFPLNCGCIALISKSLRARFTQTVNHVGLMPLLKQRFGFCIPLSLSFVYMAILFHLRGGVFKTVSRIPRRTSVSSNGRLVTRTEQLRRQRIRTQVQQSSSAHPSDASSLASGSLGLSLKRGSSECQILSDKSSDETSSRATS